MSLADAQSPAAVLEEIKIRIEAQHIRCATHGGLFAVIDEWQAEVNVTEEGVCVFRVDLPVAESEPSRTAVALMLERVGACMTIVRGSWPTGSKPSFMAQVDQGCADEDLPDALQALACCCELFMKAISVLGNEAAASRYLALSNRGAQANKEKQGYEIYRH